MKLTRKMQQYLVDEIGFVVEKMKEARDPFEKVYLLSAVHGAAFRILNLEPDPELIFIHQALSATCNQLNARVVLLSQGQERPAGIPHNLFGKLEEALEELISKIEEGKKTYPVLQTISYLAYSTTGNGYYLYLKGALTV